MMSFLYLGLAASDALSGSPKFISPTAFEVVFLQSACPFPPWRRLVVED